jgi:hypothetical protein
MFSGFCHSDQHNVQETIDMYFVSRFITESGLGVLPLRFDLLWLQATLTQLGDSMEQCTYTADISTGLAIAAFIFLLIGQVFTMFVVILFILSWCDFLSISLFGEFESLLILCRFSFCGVCKKKVSNSWPLGLWKLRLMENAHICLNGGIFATVVNFLGLLRAQVEWTCLCRE